MKRLGIAEQRVVPARIKVERRKALEIIFEGFASGSVLPPRNMPAMASRIPRPTKASVVELVSSVAPRRAISSHGEKAIMLPGSGRRRSRILSALAIARLPPALSPAVESFVASKPLSSRAL
jgi:hypothetical protein